MNTDKMWDEYEAWALTSPAFECVQASDFKEVWSTAYNKGVAQALAYKPNPAIQEMLQDYPEIGRILGKIDDRVRALEVARSAPTVNPIAQG